MVTKLLCFGDETSTTTAGCIELYNGNTTASPPQSPPLISEEVMDALRFMNWTITWGALSILGTVTNILNMAVFLKTGFKDTITISLFALAISDFGSCVTLIWVPPFGAPWVRKMELNFDPDSVVHMYAAWPHVAFTKITTLITAFICFERCVCVYAPLKVKSIVTRKLVIGYLVFSNTLVICVMAPIYYAHPLRFQFNPAANRSILSLAFAKHRDLIIAITYPMLNVAISQTCFVLILIATILLIWKLGQQTKWRMKTLATQSTKPEDGKDSNTSSGSNKERKISKMVALISTLFIIGYIPTTCLHLAVLIEKRLDSGQSHVQITFIVAQFTFLMETLNAAVNIFIYYANSTNYKTVFTQLFHKSSLK